MRLLAATASHFLSAHINPEGLDDDAIIALANADGKLPPALLTELKLRFGDDLQGEFNGNNFCTFVRIYAAHAKDEELFSLFLDYQKRTSKGGNNHVAEARSLFDQYIYALRELVKEFEAYTMPDKRTVDFRLHDKKIHDLAIIRVPQPAIEGTTSLATAIITKFKASNPFMKRVLPEVFGSEDDFKIILLGTTIQAAKIARQYGQAINKDDSLMREMATFILRLPTEQRATPESVMRNIDEDLLKDWKLSAKAMKPPMRIKDLIRAAIGFSNEVPDDREVERRKDEGEVEGHHSKAKKSQDDEGRG